MSEFDDIDPADIDTILDLLDEPLPEPLPPVDLGEELDALGLELTGEEFTMFLQLALARAGQRGPGFRDAVFCILAAAATDFVKLETGMEN